MLDVTIASNLFPEAVQHNPRWNYRIRWPEFGHSIPVRTQFRSSIMQSIYEAAAQTNRVTALYADRALSFNLPKTATFAELADRLDSLGDRSDATPTAIYMKFSMSFEPITLQVAC
jgi:hypothetical protein